MRIELHIGLAHCGATRIQSVLADKRDQLSAKGIRFAKSPGNKNHTRLWMAVTDPDHVDPLRFNRGYLLPEKQAQLHANLIEDLQKEVATHAPEVLILSASQLCWLSSPSELSRLHKMLRKLSDDIHITAHLDAPARVLSRVYGAQVMEGRAAPLSRELHMTEAENWWQSARDTSNSIDPQIGIFAESQGAPFWLDYTALQSFWEGEFGSGTVRFRSYDEAGFASPEVTEEIAHAFGLDVSFGKTGAEQKPQPMSDAWLARGRQFNALLLQVLAQRDYVLPRQAWRMFLNEIRVPGDPLDVASLSPITKYFAKDLAALAKAHPGLSPQTFKTPRAKAAWQEADPTLGFRASQYLLAFMWRIENASKAEAKAKGADLAAHGAQQMQTTHDAPEPDARPNTQMPPRAIENYHKLRNSPFAPHNRLGAVNEEELAAAYSPAPRRDLADGRTGNVIVGCMKNEAPYILEWVAHHRAIGVDNFLIYTNGCEDGTSEMLDRLQAMGLLQHRLNDDWQGNSPQQWALNSALEEPVIQSADWIIHIDVDEFMNIRCGNGTLDDFFAEVPDATNVAMTWRLFGHSGVTKLEDKLVIDQFDRCAPKYCPKPHTVWGFKTMFQNIGAYEKISCHRPNKLTPGMEERVRWANGSGRDMTGEAIKNGWRNSKKSIGYDLIQLNHYALRSAESFLIKRQRGRALHVDRSIGLNYWIRMDWNDHRDITIKRNIPRVTAERDRLLQDPELARLHAQALDWHRAKADELHAMDEFQDLYRQALDVRLTEMERVAYALALDMES